MRCCLLIVLASIVVGVLCLMTPASAQPATEASADAVSATDVARARTTLHEILSRREFTRDEGKAWTDVLRRELSKWLEKLLDRIGASRSTVSTIGRTLAWGVAIAALLAFAFLLFRLRRPRESWQQLALDAPPRLSSREWAARAADALRAGDAREAIRCGYHAALFRFEEQGVWRVDDARTPREYLSLLPRHDARRVALVDLTRDFELAWYGSQAADARGLLERLEVLGCGAPRNSTIASS